MDFNYRSALYWLIDLGKVTNLIVFQFAHLCERGNNISYRVVVDG